MASHIVCYDLHAVGQKYDCIVQKLKTYHKYCRVQRSVWIVITSNTPEQIFDKLASCIDDNDKRFIAQLTREATWIGHSKKITDWITANL